MISGLSRPRGRWGEWQGAVTDRPEVTWKEVSSGNK